MSVAEGRVLDRLLEPLSRCLTAEAARALIDLRVDSEVQAHIDDLADKCTEGMLSEEERAEYEAVVTAIDIIAILQSKARTLLGSPARSTNGPQSA